MVHPTNRISAGAAELKRRKARWETGVAGMGASWRMEGLCQAPEHPPVGGDGISMEVIARDEAEGLTHIAGLPILKPGYSVKAHLTVTTLEGNLVDR